MNNNFFLILSGIKQKIFGKHIVAKNREHLIKLIKKEISLNGYQCDLNHIDVSKVTNLGKLFYDSDFNGDISKWDVSNVTNMNFMFEKSKFNGDISNWNTSNVKEMWSLFRKSEFNGDISNWDVSNVENMDCMFQSCKFNGDISKWDVSNVINMNGMFCQSQFNANLSKWKPYKLEKKHKMFKNCFAPIPYWSTYDDKEDRIRAINNYLLNQDLHAELSKNNHKRKIMKI
jgi:surface protein